MIAELNATEISPDSVGDVAVLATSERILAIIRSRLLCRLQYTVTEWGGGRSLKELDQFLARLW